MPMPGWWGQINKRGVQPVGAQARRSAGADPRRPEFGTIYRTPLDAHPVDGGYLFILVVYGSGSDWVRNLLAAGHARLKVGGEESSSPIHDWSTKKRRGRPSAIP
jgi:hypothetical protein